MKLGSLAEAILFQGEAETGAPSSRAGITLRGIADWSLAVDSALTTSASPDGVPTLHAVLGQIEAFLL